MPKNALSRLAMPIAMVLLIAFATAPPRALANDPYECIDDLSEYEIDYRLRWIERHFAEHERYSKIWWWGWLSVMGAAAISHAVAFFAIPDQPTQNEYRMLRERMFINAVGATFTTGQMSILAMTSAHAPRKLRKMPANTVEEKRTKLHRAVTLLERSSERQILGKGAHAHAAGIGWAIGTGTYLTVRDHDALTLAQAFVLPLVVVQGRIFTQPRAAIRAYEQYRVIGCFGREGFALPPLRTVKRADWDITPGLGSLFFTVNF
ncbi:MAG: hypothetical protein GX614_10130 [Sandaracinaceae bacterium]|nr:hypothetical protein [Sandaracinaceae bacterium]